MPVKVSLLTLGKSRVRARRLVLGHEVIYRSFVTHRVVCLIPVVLCFAFEPT